jgi:peptidoglycan hydrolase-like protein with peptidoglycan-binding domain
MRVAARVLTIPMAALICMATGVPVAQAQSGMPSHLAAAASKGGKTSQRKARPAKKPRARARSKSNDKKDSAKGVAATYAAMPLAARAAIQFDLNWTGHYSGLASGEFSERSINAVKAFQKDHGSPPTGILADDERAALAAAAKARQEQAGWRMVEDRATGAQVGLPRKLAPRESKGRSGTRWQSAQGQLQIETFRVREPGATLATVLEDQKKEPPNRQIGSVAMRDNHFVLTGLQGLKRFMVLGEMRDLEIRGITVLYDQAIENATTHVGRAVLSAFGAFPGSGVMALIAPPAPSRIEYGTGIVVTADGHVLTDRRLADGCSVLEIAGHGDAARLAEQDGVTLLRVFGASALTPAAIVHPGIRLSELTLVGIAHPQEQGGRREASATTSRLTAEGLDPSPQPGFAGAAALDSQGRIAGMVSLKSPVLTAAGTTSVPPATIAPIASIREFLDAQSVRPSNGAAGVEQARSSVVRVICVRR